MESGGGGAEQKRWRRPEGPGAPPFPREYDRFEGKRPMPDGRLPAFWIRDATPDQLPEISAQMEAYFERDETLSRATQQPDDAESMAQLHDLWRDSVTEQRTTLVAMTDWPDGGEHLVGCSVLSVVRHSDPKTKMRGVSLRKIYDAIDALMDEEDVFARYGVDCYMGGVGLSVAPEWRGQGVGLRLLLAREPLCCALHVPLSVTLFTSDASQRMAARAGFEVLRELRHDEYAAGGEVVFAGAAWPFSQLMAKHYGHRDA